MSLRLNGGIQYDTSGLTASIRAMHVDSELIGISNENIGGFDKVGYQRKEAVVSSFAEYLGVHAVFMLYQQPEMIKLVVLQFQIIR